MALNDMTDGQRICFDHEQVRDQNKCVLFAAIASVLVMKFKALEQLILWVVVQPRCVVGPRVSPAYFVDRDRFMCTRMSMDIRVHIGRNPRSQHGEVEPYQLHL